MAIQHASLIPKIKVRDSRCYDNSKLAFIRILCRQLWCRF